jgi:hypothetical protein
LSRKYSPDRVLNPLPRRIFRTRISGFEIASTAGLVLLLVLAGIWIGAQRDNFDPGERDISLEALTAGSIEELPYHAPVVRWREPGEAAASSAAPSLGIFPSDLLEDGWRLDGRVETYDADNLYEKINGQAEQYLSFGFEKLHYITLTRDGLFVTIELYDQSQFRNTLGVFASQRDPSQQVMRRGPIYFYPTAVGAIGLMDNLFFKITASSSNEAVAEKTDAVIDALATLPREPDAADPAFTVLAERMDLPFENIAFEKENALQYDFLREVWFGTLEDPQDARVFLHRAASSDEADTLFRQLVEEQKFEYEPVADEADRAVMRHEFLGTWFTTARREGWLYGVQGAPDEATAVRLLASLEKELS